MRNCFLSLCLLLALPFSSFAQFDLSSLYYDSSKSYLKGEEVLLESDPSEIYTSKVDVPAGFPPPNSTYWSTSTEHVGDLTSTYSNDLANPPSSDNIEDVNVSDIGSPPPDEPPAFTETVLSVGFSENSTAEVAIIAAVNADSYLLSEQFDYQLFDFNQTSQKLTFLSPPDYESLIDDNNSDGVYTVVILATNDSGTTNQTLNVSINNVIEAPTLSDGSSASVNFTSGSSGTVYTANATDGAIYSLSGGDDASLFSINTVTGELSFNAPPDYENPSDLGSDNSYSVKITAANTVGSSELTLTIAVADDTDDNSITDDPDLPNAGSTDVVLGGISTTGYISGNGGRLSAGFAISGGNMTVLTTGKGAKEYLSTGSLQDTLNDPKMEIKALSGNSWSSQHADLNWKTGNYFSELNATGFFALYEDDDTGIYETLSANNYLAEITSTDGDSGGTLVEVYETYGYWNSTYTGSKLEGISTNGYVRAGNEPGQRMTVGVALRNFGTDESATKRVIVMAKWSTYVPSNDNDATNDFDILDDPRIEVTDANKNILAQNDNWGTLPASLKSAIEKTGLMTGFREDKDAAVIVNLPGSGVYFMNVYSADGDSGGSLVEVYDLDALEEKYGWNLGN